MLKDLEQLASLIAPAVDQGIFEIEYHECALAITDIIGKCS